MNDINDVFARSKNVQGCYSLIFTAFIVEFTVEIYDEINEILYKMSRIDEASLAT